MTTPISITVRYFASLREQRGLNEETYLTVAATAADLYRELLAAHKFSLRLEDVGVAVNEHFSAQDCLLSEGDRVAFIPPVAGG